MLSTSISISFSSWFWIRYQNGWFIAYLMNFQGFTRKFACGLGLGGHETIKNRTLENVKHLYQYLRFELVLNPISEWVINSLFDEFLRSLMSKICTFSKYHQNQFWHMLQDVKKYAEFESDIRMVDSLLIWRVFRVLKRNFDLFSKNVEQ